MPLFDEELTTSALALLGDLSVSLRARTQSPHDPSLLTGESGLTLAHLALDRVCPGQGHDTLAERTLHAAVQGLETSSLDPGLWEGIAGVAWTMELVAGDRADEASSVDAALEIALTTVPWHGPFDLAAGLVGVGVYALERLPRLSATRILEQVVDRLESLAERQEDGIAWRFSDACDGWDLGVAHGMPGVVAFLGRAVMAGVRVDVARRLLDQAIPWLLAQRLPEDQGGAFPRIALGSEAARLAWCYGDPGVACALLVAARAVGEHSWEAEAVRVGVRAAQRDVSTGGVVDGAICHGASGLGHMFHRLYSATGEVAFADASRAWFRRLFELPRESSYGFLYGQGGVALTLATALDETTVAGWDRALLITG